MKKDYIRIGAVGWFCLVFHILIFALIITGLVLGIKGLKDNE